MEPVQFHPLAQLVAYIAAHWVEWLFAGISAYFVYELRNLKKTLDDKRTKEITEKEEAKRQEDEKTKQNLETMQSIANGVCSLLRDRIMQGCRYWLELGYCPENEQRNIHELYEPYRKLGGNDVAHNAVEQLDALPIIEPKAKG